MHLLVWATRAKTVNVHVLHHMVSLQQTISQQSVDVFASVGALESRLFGSVSAKLAGTREK
jgi:hypothetical protein